MVNQRQPRIRKNHAEIKSQEIDCSLIACYRLKRQQPCREDGHSQPISIITTLVPILRMYCFHAKDIITASCFYPLEGRLDRPKYPANTQSLLSLHAAWRAAKTVNKKDSLS